MTFAELNQRIVACERCPRLVAHCREVARIKRRAYHDEVYWGRPVPGFGDPAARLLIVGLAPGAHGANRTGRMFTGDRSGDFLYPALYRAGFASQPTSRDRQDGLTLKDCWIAAAARCAPPDNKPAPEELAACRPFLQMELTLLKQVRLVIVLGRIALDAYRAARQLPRLDFAHGLLHATQPPVLCSYHPSQQNTQTGRLTVPMFDAVFAEARRIISTNEVAGYRPAGELGGTEGTGNRHGSEELLEFPETGPAGGSPNGYAPD